MVYSQYTRVCGCLSVCVRVYVPGTVSLDKTVSCINTLLSIISIRVQELCESRGGRPGLSVLMSLTVSVDVKQH